VGAVDELLRIRAEGKSVADELAQAQMFKNLPAGTAEILAFLDENVRSPAKVAAFVQNYLSELARYSAPGQEDMFGKTEAPTTAALVKTAKEATHGPEGAGGAVQPEAAAAGGAAAAEPGATGASREEGAAADAGARSGSGEAAAGEDRPAQSPADVAAKAAEVKAAITGEAEKKPVSAVQNQEKPAKPAEEKKPELELTEPEAKAGAATKRRVATAIARIKKAVAQGHADSLLSGRSWDALFEAGDGEEVVAEIRRAVGEDAELKAALADPALKDFLPPELVAEAGREAQAERIAQVADKLNDGTKDPMSPQPVLRLAAGKIAKGEIDEDLRHYLDTAEKALFKRHAPLADVVAEVMAELFPEAHPLLAGATDVDRGAHQAATSPTNARPAPTDAQIAADNAKLGHETIAGMQLSFENPEGSERTNIKVAELDAFLANESGIRDGARDAVNAAIASLEAGKKEEALLLVRKADALADDPKLKAYALSRWVSKMRAHYGRILGTIGFDKDHLDAFVRPGTPKEFAGNVFVINQDNAAGKFDEHKAMIGYEDETQARLAYLENYGPGQDSRIRSIVTLPMAQFKAWAFDQSKAGPRGGELKAPKKDFAPLNLIKTPNGRFTFVGRVPDEVYYVEGATPEEIRKGKQFGERFGPKRRVFDTRAEAVALAESKGYSVVPEAQPTGGKNAEEVRGDQGQAGSERGAGEAGANQRGEDLQQPAEPGTGAGDRTPPAGAQPEVAAYRTLADWVVGRLAYGKEAISAKELGENADRIFGGTAANGTYSPRDMYDAMELGMNLYILQNPSLFNPTNDNAKAALENLRATMARLPTQTRRTVEQNEFQQFSTPPTLAYLTAWVGAPRAGETVLEPSAGTGDIAVFAKLAGARVHVNELAPRRAGILTELGFSKVTSENAEQLNNILPESVKPTLVVMNPPFSSAGSRVEGQRSAENGIRHLAQAWARLESGGRMVAIMGENFGVPAASRQWLAKVRSSGEVRAVVAIAGREYQKYGTTYGTTLMVLDKTGSPQKGETVHGGFESVDAALEALKGVRDGRPGHEGNASLPEGERGPVERPGGGARTAVRGEPPRGEPARPVARPSPAEPAAPAQPEQPRPAAGKEGPGQVSLPLGEPGEPAPGEQGAGGSRPGGRGPEAARVREQPGAESGRPGAEPGERASGITVSGEAGARAEGAITGATFEAYTPAKVRIPGAKPHVSALVESAAMASVLPPDPTYTPNLPERVVKDALLSDAQLETVVYAGQAHESFLPDGARRGYFVGDGTGVGKGREISAILLDNIRRGRDKHVWVSEKQPLIADAKRDFEAVGGQASSIFAHATTKAADTIERQSGILFTTYSTLRSGEKRQANETNKTLAKTRVAQLIEWLGADFEGVIVFDESHNMQSALRQKGKRGAKEASLQALAGLELQAKLPKARVVYSSATGATNVVNLAYAARLGLWGEQTAFGNVDTFVNAIDAAGVSAMELVARDLKQMGLYNARSLSFRGVTYDRVTHTLSPLQRAMYNRMAEGWQTVLKNVDAALEITGGEESGQAKGAAYSAFWGAQQRFFNQVITSMQMPTTLEAIAKDLERGDAVILQLVNTMEAELDRKLALVEEDSDLADLDLTPRDQLLNYIQKSFPVQQMQEVQEGDNVVMRPAVDAAGNPVLNREAVAMRDKLLEDLRNIKVPDAPLDMIIRKFGADNVAEVTGRSQRVVPDESGKLVVQKRTASSARADAKEFMEDKKRILIFSDAGGTGYSFHSDRTQANQRRRQHYLIQPGWRADKAVQGFGRSHRSNEANQPNYRLAETNLKAQKRFISSVARRLDQLGALTKGQRQASGQELFSEKDNLEGVYAKRAITSLIWDAYANREPRVPFQEVLEGQMGLRMRNPETGGIAEGKFPDVPQFLNRLLSLTVEAQDDVFDAFFDRMEHLIEVAKQNNELDVGVQSLGATKAKKISQQTVHTDKRSGAQTHVVTLDATYPREFMDWNEVARKLDIIQEAGSKDSSISVVGYFESTHPQTPGRPFVIVHRGNTTDDSGAVVPRYIAFTPVGTQYNANPRPEHARAATRGEVQKAWDPYIEKQPDTFNREEHIITGTILPVWDRMHGKFVRVVQQVTDDGERLLGRWIAPNQLEATMKAFGMSKVAKMSAQEVMDAVMQSGATVTLANGWRLQRVRKANQNRLEVVADTSGYGNAARKELERYGAFTEVDNWKERTYLPVDDVDALAQLLEVRPPADISGVDASEVKFSVASAPSGAMSVQRAQDALDALAGQWPNAPLMYAVPSMADMPDQVRQAAAAGGWTERALAAFDPGSGAMYMVAPRIRSPQHAQWLAFHEVLGHYGLRGAFGRDLDPALEHLWRVNPKVRAWTATEAQSRGFDLQSDEGRAKAIEEAVSNLAAEGVKLNGIREFFARVQAWLRAHGLGGVADWLEGMTDAELAGVLARAKAFVTGDGAHFAGDSALPAFASSGPTWYSGLRRAVDAMNVNQAEPAHWVRELEALAAAGKVSREELEWTGLTDWLEGQGGKVAKGDVVNFLTQNGVRIETQELGGGEDMLTSEKQRLIVELTARGWRPVWDEVGEEGDYLMGFIRQSDGARRPLGGDFDHETDVHDEDIPDDVLRLMAELEEVVELNYEDAVGAPAAPHGAAQYVKYTLPGGVNYREVLLTLPQRIDFDPDKVKIVQHTSSTTQGMTTIYYDGDKLMQYSDDPQRMPDGTYQQHTPEHWLDVARKIFERGDAINNLPPRSGSFIGPHFNSTPNILAHLRVKDRTDADGRKVLFLEEVQSDWAQQGRREGFFNPLKPWDVFDPKDGIPVAQFATKAEAKAEAERRGAQFDYERGKIPSAPFVGKTESWVRLALKQAIRMAAEGGYDAVAWTTGEQQVQRYRLGQHLRAVDVVRLSDVRGDYIIRGVRTDNTKVDFGVLKAADLPGLVGEELAAKIIADPDDEKRWNVGDLEVGGSGQRAFYDKILPQVANAVLKKLGGGKIGEVQFGAHDAVDDLADALGMSRADDLNGAQPGFTITPALRESVLSGLPLFAIANAGGGPTNAPGGRRLSSYGEDSGGAPLLAGELVQLVDPQFYRDGPNGTKVYQHQIVVGRKTVGVAMVGWRDGLPRDVYYIATLKPYQGLGLAEDAVRAMLNHNGAAHALHAVLVLNEARGFWSKMGAEYVDTEEGTDGFLNLQSYDAARRRREDAKASGALPQGKERPAVAREGARGPEGAARPEALTPRFAVAGAADVNPALSDQERADAILERQTSRIRPLESIFRRAAEAVRLPKLTGGLYDALLAGLDHALPENVKAGLIDNYGVPETVVDRRDEMFGHMRRQLRDVENQIGKWALTREEARAAYQWLTQDDPAEGDRLLELLKPESREAVQALKDQITEMGTEAVRLGQLDPDTFERYKNAYLHRTYLKHELDRQRGPGGARAIRILGDEYRTRGLTDDTTSDALAKANPQWWERQLGGEDVGLKGRKFVRLERRAKSGEGMAVLPGVEESEDKGKLVRKVYWPAEEAVPAKYAEYDNAGEWEARWIDGNTVTMWRDFTAEERRAMGEIDDARYAVAKTMHLMVHDLEVGKYLEWLANTQAKPEAPRDAEVLEANESLRQAYRPGTWVRVPESFAPGTNAPCTASSPGSPCPARSGTTSAKSARARSTSRTSARCTRRCSTSGRSARRRSRPPCT
jgi:hypothetical protein